MKYFPTRNCLKFSKCCEICSFLKFLRLKNSGILYFLPFFGDKQSVKCYKNIIIKGPEIFLPIDLTYIHSIFFMHRFVIKDLHQFIFFILTSYFYC